MSYETIAIIGGVLTFVMIGGLTWLIVRSM